MQNGLPATADAAHEAGTVEENQAVGAERVLTVLMTLAEDPHGLALDEFTRALPGASKPPSTGHSRHCASWGLANQRERGTYVLGDEFIRLAFLHQTDGRTCIV